MTISLKHAKTSAVPDSGDTDVVQPSDWNDEHTLTQSADRILGRVTSGAGATEELTAAQVRTLLNVEDGATADQDLSAYQLQPSEGAFANGDKTKLDGISSGATASPLTTKGDIYGFSTVDARLPVGTNGQVLSADSTEATGLKWIALAGGGDMSAATYDPTAVGADAFAMDNMVEGTTTKILTATERTKLAGIETAADVTDTANVTAAGALMDSEVTNLAQVKAFSSTDYATAAQGTLADSAQQPPSEGAFVNGDKTKLDGIATGATANDTDANLKARANHTGTQLASTISDFSSAVSGNAAVTANTAKVSNATHTGDVTGSTALTIATNAVTAGKIASNAVTTAKILDANVTKAKLESDAQNRLNGLPQNSKSAAYTLVLADAGQHIYHPSADTTARIWTIPANASVAFPIGTTVVFCNDTSAGAITIAITSDTLVLAGDGSTGSRTLAANGMATAVKVTSTRWMISGVGLT